MVPYIRQAITTNGGTPQSFAVIGSLRELVTVYGGTPTQYSVVGLLREAVTAVGGTPTQYQEVALLRQLVTALGGTAASYDRSTLWAQVSVTSRGGGTLPATTATPAGRGGLARMVEGYTGPLCRVIRASDSAELDIEQTATGELDLAAALAFEGASSLLLHTLYNQDNANHFTTGATKPTLWLGEGGPTITNYTGTAPVLIPAALAIPRDNYAVFMVTRTPGHGATNGYWAFGSGTIEHGLTTARTAGQVQPQPVIGTTSTASSVANAQANTVANMSVVGLVSNATKQILYRDEQTAEFPPAAALTMSAGGQFLEALTYDGRNDCCAFALYSTAPTDPATEAPTIVSSLKSIFRTALPATESWLFQGDSIVFGTGGSNNRTITAAIEHRSARSLLLRNRGIAGHQLSTHYQDYDTLSTAWLTPGVVNGYTSEYGHNDIKNGALDLATALSIVAAMKAQLQYLCAKLRTYGFNLIIWQELIADTSVSWTADMESARDAWNAWLRTFPLADDGLPCFDALDTLASDNSFVLSDFETDAGRGMTLSSLSSDGVHPNESVADERAVKWLATKAAIPMTLKYLPITTGNVSVAYAGATPLVVLATGTVTYSMAPSSTALPAGLTLNTSTGVISGTPTTIATTTGLILRVTDGVGAISDSAAFQIAVAASQQVTVASVTESYSATDVTALNVALPATINVGDKLLAFLSLDGGSGATITWDNATAGTWTTSFNDTQTANRCMVFSKTADGTEGGKTLAITISGAQQIVVQVYRLTGAEGTIAVSATGARATTGTAPDPISVTAPWGVLNNLFIVGGAFDNVASVTAVPSGYGNASTRISSASGQAGLTTAYKSAVSASDDPGVFTVAPSLASICVTVVVRPA